MKIRQLVLTFLQLSVLIFSSAFFVPLKAQALPEITTQAPDLGLEYPAASNLTDADPRILVANVIRAAMGLLGVVAIVIIIIAGFDWMTAGGNDEKVGVAKKWLTAGVIGLIIILGAYSLANFVVSQLVRATIVGESSITP